jgi:hypothetical protein
MTAVQNNEIRWLFSRFFARRHSLRPPPGVRELPDRTLKFILVVAVRQAPHHFHGVVDVRAIPAGRAGRIYLPRFRSRVGCLEGYSSCHDGVCPGLAGNSEFRAEIVES